MTSCLRRQVEHDGQRSADRQHEDFRFRLGDLGAVFGLEVCRDDGVAGVGGGEGGRDAVGAGFNFAEGGGEDQLVVGGGGVADVRHGETAFARVEAAGGDAEAGDFGAGLGAGHGFHGAAGAHAGEGERRGEKGGGEIWSHGVSSKKWLPAFSCGEGGASKEKFGVNEEGGTGRFFVNGEVFVRMWGADAAVLGVDDDLFNEEQGKRDNEYARRWTARKEFIQYINEQWSTVLPEDMRGDSLVEER